MGDWDGLDFDAVGGVVFLPGLVTEGVEQARFTDFALANQD